MEALEAPDTWDETLDGPARAVLRLADAMCADSHALDPNLVGELREHFTEAQLAELILVAGQANLNNRAGNAAKQLLGDGPGGADQR